MLLPTSNAALLLSFLWNTVRRCSCHVPASPVVCACIPMIRDEPTCTRLHMGGV